MMTGEKCEYCGHIVPFPCKEQDDAAECPLNDNPDEEDDS